MVTNKTEFAQGYQHIAMTNRSGHATRRRHVPKLTDQISTLNRCVSAEDQSTSWQPLTRSGKDCSVQGRIIRANLQCGRISIKSLADSRSGTNRSPSWARKLFIPQKIEVRPMFYSD